MRKIPGESSQRPVPLLVIGAGPTGLAALFFAAMRGIEAIGIEAGGAGGDQVAADQEVVVFRYPAVKPGQSLRLRLSETYTAPQSYRLDGEDLVFERSLGRPRNSIVLPKG